MVDDLCDSGATIKKVVEHLKRNYPQITEIRVAVIWVKACSVFHPDYSVVQYTDSPWIHQPFECYDDIGIEKHLANCRAKFREKSVFLISAMSVSAIAASSSTTRALIPSGSVSLAIAKTANSMPCPVSVFS